MSISEEARHARIEELWDHITLLEPKNSQLKSRIEEPERKLLELDHDVSHAHTGNGIALLVHGDQAKGSGARRR
jgi:hypothetical protein